MYAMRCFAIVWIWLAMKRHTPLQQNTLEWNQTSGSKAGMRSEAAFNGQVWKECELCEAR